MTTPAQPPAGALPLPPPGQGDFNPPVIFEPRVPDDTYIEDINQETGKARWLVTSFEAVLAAVNERQDWQKDKQGRYPLLFGFDHDEWNRIESTAGACLRYYWEEGMLTIGQRYRWTFAGYNGQRKDIYVVPITAAPAAAPDPAAAPAPAPAPAGAPPPPPTNPMEGTPPCDCHQRQPEWDSRVHACYDDCARFRQAA